MTHRRRAPLALAAVALLVTAACADDADSASVEDGSTTTSSQPTSASSIGEPGPLRDYRYCEVITVGTDDDGDGIVDAGVWNTMPLNECPQEAFANIDAAQAAIDLGVELAVPNGPRYWVLDSIQAESEVADAGMIHDFGGIEMRLAATVAVDPSNRSPYTETSVARDTVFTFRAGREVPVLTAPDGSWYVMQSYSLEVDPDLTLAALPQIQDQLDLPDGWSFESRMLDGDLDVLSLDGVATVVQDDLRNTYQLVSRG